MARQDPADRLYVKILRSDLEDLLREAPAPTQVMQRYASILDRLRTPDEEHSPYERSLNSQTMKKLYESYDEYDKLQEKYNALAILVAHATDSISVYDTPQRADEIYHASWNVGAEGSLSVTENELRLIREAIEIKDNFIRTEFERACE